MAFDPILAIRFSAFAVGMMAQTNQLSKSDVDELLAKASTHLDTDDQFLQAIAGFDLLFQANRFDATHLASIGADLVRAVQLEMLPTAPDAHRVDIHG
tara:strand:- start:21792 stop:22085 length:294 start_codon:yes stop_codon:yes gene_type:complete